MKIIPTAISVLTIAAVPHLYADTMAGSAKGTVDSVTIDAATGTTSIWTAHGADVPDDFQPYPFSGDWSFTFNGDTVDFTGAFDIGDCQTTTNAGFMGGISKQIFFGFVHHVKGTGQWDEASSTLSFTMEPEGRDDARASTVTQTQDPECEKVKGMFAGKACSAFEATSPGLEGLTLNFKFNEDRTAFEGQAVLTQYGGKGITESDTKMVANFKGTLAAQ